MPVLTPLCYSEISILDLYTRQDFFFFLRDSVIIFLSSNLENFKREKLRGGLGRNFCLCVPEDRCSETSYKV